MSRPNGEPYFWHFNRKVLSAAAPEEGGAKPEVAGVILRPQSSGQCPVNTTVPSFTSFFICAWYKK